MGVRHDSAVFSSPTWEAGVDSFVWLEGESVRDWNGWPAWTHSFSINTRSP